MAKFNSNGLRFYVNSEDAPGELEMIYCSNKVSRIINRSDLKQIDDTDKIIGICIPDDVETINPNAFIDCVNLSKVEIDGSTFGIELSLGTGCKASVSIDETELPEILKAGKGPVYILRSPL